MEPLSSLAKTNPSKAGIKYLDVNKIPNRSGLVLPKTGAKKKTIDASLVPIPAKEIGSKPINTEKISTKTPDKLESGILIEEAKINI